MPASLLGIDYADAAGIVWNESDRTKTRVLTDVYKVSAATAEEAESLSSLPRIGDAHSANFFARCISRHARFSAIDGRTVGNAIYDVDVEYSTIASVQPGDEDTAPDPWDLEPEWWWDSETIEVLKTVDAVTGDDIENSAGDRINALVPIPIPILHVERYELTFDPDVILDYCCHTNSAIFWGAPIDAAMMWRITPRRETVQGTKLWRVHYEVKFRIDGQYGWLGRFLDEGYNYLDGGVKKRAIDDLGNPIKVNLTAAGAKLAVGSPKHYLTFNTVPQADFNTLQLGPF